MSSRQRRRTTIKASRCCVQSTQIAGIATAMDAEQAHICKGCGVQFSPHANLPSMCPICADERQAVPEYDAACAVSSSIALLIACVLMWRTCCLLGAHVAACGCLEVGSNGRLTLS